jgi:hypothetical protein
MTAKFQSPLEPLLQHATAREREAIEAVLEHGTGPAAAAALGVSCVTINQRLQNARRRAQRRALGAAAPPAGFVPVSVASDAEGRVRSVRSRAEGPEEHLPRQPEGFQLKFISTLTNAAGEVSAQWARAEPEKAAAEAAFWEGAELHVRRYRGLAAPVRAPAACDASTETWYPLGDPHLGLLAHRAEVGIDADLRIAERVLLETVDLLVARAPASERAVLCQLGDYFHSDSNANRTISGHQLDVDSRHAKVAEVGFNLMRRMVTRLLEKHASVTVINAPGNHAPNTEKMMALWLSAVFEREPRVTVEASTNPYIYRRFGTNLIGVHHGDGAKMASLGEIMAADRPEDWGATTHRMWMTGHIHHDSRKDLRGCSVESFRTMQSPDAWSHHAGYRSGRSLQAITFHVLWGEQGRVTVGVRELTGEVA